MFKRILQFTHNDHYVNICRTSYKDLYIVDTKNIQYPQKYFARKGKVEPALFVSLVEVKQSHLVTPTVVVQQKEPYGIYEKKHLIANLFRQEFELLVCTLGCIYGVDDIALPSWSDVDETRGLTFHTRIAQSKDGELPSMRISS